MEKKLFSYFIAMALGVFSLPLFSFSEDRADKNSQENPYEEPSETENEREPAWLNSWDPKSEYQLDSMMDSFHKRQDELLKNAD